MTGPWIAREWVRATEQTRSRNEICRATLVFGGKTLIEVAVAALHAERGKLPTSTTRSTVCAVARGFRVTVRVGTVCAHDAGLPIRCPWAQADTPGNPRSVHALEPMLVNSNGKYILPAAPSPGTPIQTTRCDVTHRGAVVLDAGVAIEVEAAQGATNAPTASKPSTDDLPRTNRLNIAHPVSTLAPSPAGSADSY
jgi:hypothetical protein